MNKILSTVLLFLALVLPVHVRAQTVTTILGATVACDPNVDTCLYFPTQGVFLCNGGGAILDCPQWFAPDWPGNGSRFFGITNRTNPPRCVQSTDGGTVWGLCPSNPFSSAVDFFGAFFTVASDGSLISAADQGANNCIIRRSTDYGVSWSTVYTDTTAGVSCGVSFGNPTSNNAICAQSGGYCVVVNRDSVFDLWAVYSTDNGANWTKGVAFTIVNGNQTVSVKTNGTRGALTRFGVNYGGSQPLGEQIFSDWDNTAATPLPVGSIGTASVGATAILVGGSTEAVIAGPTSNPPTTHYLYEIGGGVPLQTASFIPVDSAAFVNGPVLMAHGYAGDIGYFISRSLSVGTAFNLYITLDRFDNVSLVQQLTPATALIPGCCTGDIHTYNGRVYFSSGGTSTQAFLVRIQ